MLLFLLLVCFVLFGLTIYYYYRKRSEDAGYGVLPKEGFNTSIYYLFLGVLGVLMFILLFLLFGRDAGSDSYDQKVSTGASLVNQYTGKVDENQKFWLDFTAEWGESAENPFEWAKLKWLYSVDKVIDWDTIRIWRNGVSERVRFIGINTPELDTCFSYPAKDFLQEKIGGGMVYLEMDDTQWTYDKYGRTLAYVYTQDKENLNFSLVDGGYAKEYTYNTPYKYQKLFKDAQLKAQKNNRWMWNDCK